MYLNNISNSDDLKKQTVLTPTFNNSNLANNTQISPRKFLIGQDTVTFSSKQKVEKPKQNLFSKLISFTGAGKYKQQAEKYLQDFDFYRNSAELHNRLLYSYGVPMSMAQVVNDMSAKTYETKDQIFTRVQNSMLDTYQAMKTSPVMVVEGTDLNDSTVVDAKTYDAVRQIYSDVLGRLELFDRVQFDSKEQKLKEHNSEEFIQHKLEDFKHIINDLLPEIMKSKKIIMQDPANIHKLLADEVMQGILLDKLVEEAPEGMEDYEMMFSDIDGVNRDFVKEPKINHDHEHHDNDYERQDHHNNHKVHNHDHDGNCEFHHDHEHQTDKAKDDHDHHDHDHKHHHTPRERLDQALQIAHRIHEKYDINMLSKVPEHFYDPDNEDKKAHNTPDDYYDSKTFGLRHQPRNFYEAQFLKTVAKNIKGFKADNTVIVTPKAAAGDIVQKIKAMNKEYLYIEDWLYKYCLGDEKTKQDVIKHLDATASPEAQKEIKALAKDLDDYINNFINVYDIKKPENTQKLNDVMKDYSKINCMSEISRGYFLGVGEDATSMVKNLIVFALFLHGAEHLAEATGIKFIINLSNTANSVADDVLDASKNYLKWKKELGDEKANEKLQKTISHSLTISLPTLGMSLSKDAGIAEHLAFRNLSSGSTYAIMFSNFAEYHNKLEELIDKGLKKVPDEVKDNPDKLAKWKMTQAWAGYAAHSLNVGTFLGLALSQPFAAAAGPMMLVGGRSLIVALAGTFECWTSNIYLLLDASRWNKFTNKLKEQFVNDKEAKMTPEEYLERRKVFTTRVVQGPVGQTAFITGKKISDHTPQWSKTVVKKVYSAIYTVVDKTLGKFIAGTCKTILDRKYNHMSEEEREKIEGSKCGHNH